MNAILIVTIKLFKTGHTFKNSFGSRNTPTPLGVPVRIMSPGNNVIKLKMFYFLIFLVNNIFCLLILLKCSQYSY